MSSSDRDIIKNNIILVTASNTNEWGYPSFVSLPLSNIEEKYIRLYRDDVMTRGNWMDFPPRYEHFLKIISWEELYNYVFEVSYVKGLN